MTTLTTEQQERIEAILEQIYGTWKVRNVSRNTAQAALTELQLACNAKKEELWQQILSVHQILDERNEALNNRMNQVGSLTAKVAELEAKASQLEDQAPNWAHDRIATLESQLKVATDALNLSRKYVPRLQAPDWLDKALATIDRLGTPEGQGMSELAKIHRLHVQAFEERDETRRWLMDIALKLGVKLIDGGAKEQHECWRNLYWLILAKLPATQPEDKP